MPAVTSKPLHGGEKAVQVSQPNGKGKRQIVAHRRVAVAPGKIVTKTRTVHVSELVYERFWNSNGS